MPIQMKKSSDIDEKYLDEIDPLDTIVDMSDIADVTQNFLRELSRHFRAFANSFDKVSNKIGRMKK